MKFTKGKVLQNYDGNYFKFTLKVFILQLMNLTMIYVIDAMNK